MAEKKGDDLVIHASEVIDGVAFRRCPHCNELKSLAAFGARRMAGQGKDGSDLITNQSWCTECRSHP